MNLKVFIRHYKANYRPNTENEFDWFENQPSFESAVINASEAKDERGKMYSHQCCVNAMSIKNAKAELLENIDNLEKSDSFHSLWLLLNRLIKPISGIGELYVYDAALRIGAFLKLYPEKVYLHAGTRIGAKRLKIKNSNEDWIEPSELPKELQELSMKEDEDILCIYKDDFIKGKIDSAKPCAVSVKNTKKPC